MQRTLTLVLSGMVILLLVAFLIARNMRTTGQAEAEVTSQPLYVAACTVDPGSQSDPVVRCEAALRQKGTEQPIASPRLVTSWGEPAEAVTTRADTDLAFTVTIDFPEDGAIVRCRAVADIAGKDLAIAESIAMRPGG